MSKQTIVAGVPDATVEEGVVQALYESDKIAAESIHEVADAIMEALRNAGEGFE